MKRYRLEGADEEILKPLCKYFRLDVRDITYVQKAEMAYIHQRLSEWLPQPRMEDIIAEIDRLRLFLEIRGKRRSLYHVFYWCQAQHMKRGAYDTKTKRPPISPSVGDYY